MKTIRLRRDTAVNWDKWNPVLEAGEVGVELNTGRFKVGNGGSVWTHLPYFIPIDPNQPVTDAALLAHIQALTPHPTYDEIPSLTLIFENGLV